MSVSLSLNQLRMLVQEGALSLSIIVVLICFGVLLSLILALSYPLRRYSQLSERTGRHLVRRSLVLILALIWISFLCNFSQLDSANLTFLVAGIVVVNTVFLTSKIRQYSVSV